MRAGKRCRVLRFTTAGRGHLLVAAALAFAAAVRAADEAPVTREQATAIVEQSKRDSAEIERRYLEARRECEQGVLVNPCLERARRARDEQARAVREREVAARDSLRRIDAEARARERDARAAARKADGAAGVDRSTLERDSPGETAAAKRPAVQPPTTDPARQEAEARKKAEEAARRRAEADQRAAEQQRRTAARAEKAAQAAAETEKYEAKQREAQAHAEEKARLAEENRQRRERRARERSEGKKSSP